MTPGVDPFSQRTPRVVAARRLQRRRDRDETGRFLAEGPQAVREALAVGGCVIELFATADAIDRHSGIVKAARGDGAPVSEITDDGLASLAETVTPQGLVAVCRHLDVTLSDALTKRPRLVAVLAGIRDPGNAGTVLRTADAAGADAVVFAGETVDPYNGKAVRASAGSLFHVDVVRAGDPELVVATLRDAGLTVLAADGYGNQDLDTLADDGALAGPTAWVFGSEAHGLPPALAEATDARVRVPIHGRAESLNLAAAAAVCLYASARAHRTMAP
jgi:TrmH family RNA methyltransferase